MKAYKAIGSYCEVLIPLEKRPKVYKVKAKTEFRRLLTVLRSKIYLAYVPAKNMVTKTLFIKLYESKNLLILEGVIKSIGIRLLNDVAIIEDSIGEGVSLDLLEIDDIGFPELTTPEVLGSFRPLEPVPGSFKSFKKLIELVDSLNLDEI